MREREERILDGRLEKRISGDPDVILGKPVIRRTPIPVEPIVQLLAPGSRRVTSWMNRPTRR